jgi:hypothetical protein
VDAVLVARFEVRQTNAETTAAAAVTGVLGLAALTATAAKMIEHINKTVAWIVAGVLAAVCVLALVARFLAGLHISSRPSARVRVASRKVAAISSCQNAAR